MHTIITDSPISLVIRGKTHVEAERIRTRLIEEFPMCADDFSLVRTREGSGVRCASPNSSIREMALIIAQER
jgi:hypothetical protein